MEIYTLYAHITPSNKIYFGITSKPTNVRWGTRGNGYQTQKYFYRAIQKYGWDNMQHIVIMRDLDFEIACDLEKYFINKYDTTNPKKGYNVSTGGDFGNSGHKASEETREKMRKNNSHFWLGRHHTEESKQKMREAKLGKPNFKLRGHKRSEENKQKISENNGMHTKQGYENWYKSTHTEEYIEKLRNAALNMTEETKHKISVTMGKPVQQFDLDNNLIAEYYSLTEASKQTGISVNSIRFNCEGKIKKPRQFIWKFRKGVN